MASEVAWNPSLWSSAGGAVPLDWDLIPFSELLQSPKSIAVGVMYPGEQTSGGVPLVRVGDVGSGGVVKHPSMSISDAVHQEYRRTELIGDELLITLVGTPGVCVVARPEMKGWNVARALAVARLKRPELRPYIKAVMESAVMRSIITSMLNTTVQPTLNLKEIKTLPLPMPRDVGTAQALGDFAERFNHRIALLQATNATLEAIAQALFRSWFVDFDPVRAKAEGREPEGMDAATAALFPSEFEESEPGLIPKGWRRGPLGDLCRNIRQQAKPDSLDPTTPYIGLEHMPRGSIALTEAGSASGLASGKFWYAKNDVLFGKLRPYFHKVGVASHTGVCSTDILVVRANEPDWFGLTAMQLSSDGIIAYATRLSNGAKMPRSSWSDIAAYKVVIPPEPVARSFDGVVRAIIERIHANIDLATNLACLRDILLPRLISGKLRLPEVEKAIEEVVA